MAEWHYVSSGGDRYPVKPHEVWRAGPHRLACGDLEAGDGERLIKRFGQRPDLVYCDPPWNNGNAAAFRTKAGVPRQVNFTTFLDVLMAVVRLARRDVFLEMGRAGQAHLVERAERCGGQAIRTWPITYYRRHPATLTQLRFNGAGLEPPDLAGLDDDDTPGAVMRSCSRPGDVVMDPCMGRGLTAATAGAAQDRTFIGLELSPWRMSCALSKLAALGYAIEREGTL